MIQCCVLVHKDGREGGRSVGLNDLKARLAASSAVDCEMRARRVVHATIVKPGSRPFRVSATPPHHRLTQRMSASLRQKNPSTCVLESKFCGCDCHHWPHPPLRRIHRRRGSRSLGFTRAVLWVPRSEWGG